jgi:hypothetical protein
MYALPATTSADGVCRFDGFAHHGFWADEVAVNRARFGDVVAAGRSDTTGDAITVNMTGSAPNALFPGTDTFDVGSQTIVLGNSGSPSGSLGNVGTGGVVAGGLIAADGDSTGTVTARPLRVLVGFPQSFSSSSSATAQLASVRPAERRARQLLRPEKAMSGHHEKKWETVFS